MSKRIYAAIGLILITVLCTVGLGIVKKNKDVKESVAYDGKAYSETRECFGTVLTITLYAKEDEAKSITKKAFSECARLENIFSAKLDDSELSRLNATAADVPVNVSSELMEVFCAALYYNELSDGALDISVGGLVKLWGIGTQDEKVPSAEEILPFVNADGCKYIVIDEKNGTITYTSDKISVDLGAVAKGYAAGKIKELILENMENAAGIISFGGNIVTVGSKENGEAWNIGITNPLRPSEICGKVSGTDMCVVTSGNYERYFVKDGVRYHHILDPFTGYPADNGIISATIVGNDSMQCDALSTACYILGVENALALINSIDGVEAVFIDDSGKSHASDGMSKYNLNIGM